MSLSRVNTITEGGETDPLPFFAAFVYKHTHRHMHTNTLNGRCLDLKVIRF